MRRVLLVEGDTVEHAGLVERLRADGCEVLEVVGRRRLSQLIEKLVVEQQPPDLIIADADKSGIDLVLAAHQRLGGPPLILLTETVDIELVRDAELLAPRYVFCLPYEVEALRSANRALSNLPN